MCMSFCIAAGCKDFHQNQRPEGSNHLGTVALMAESLVEPLTGLARIEVQRLGECFGVALLNHLPEVRQV